MLTKLEGIRQKVFMDRYSLKDSDGKPTELTPEEMWARVARGVAEAEYPENRDRWETNFYDIMSDFKFVPGGRILTGAGSGHKVTYYNCFVLPQPEDSRHGILNTLHDMIEIQARGGGVGINFSSLRPCGSYIKTVNGHSSGPVPWMELFAVATADVIQQGGSRRGALMIMLDSSHPDIYEFIGRKSAFSKTDGELMPHPRYLQGANISLAIDDGFMEAVQKGQGYDLHWDRKVYKTIEARDLWEKIAYYAWKSADPGLVFMERYNKESNSWYFEDIRCVNPCGEQGLGPYGVCNLGSMNIAAYVKNGRIDYNALSRDVAVATRFLDNIIDISDYFLPQTETAQKQNIRRIGLGTMGIADALIMMKVRYGSDEAVKIVAKIFEVIRDAAYSESVRLSIERGSFGKFDPEQYVKGRFIQRLPKSVRTDVGKYGTRNCFLLTQAPTGTTSLLAGVSSGIEPVFDFAMVRRDRTGEHIMYHPLYQEWLDQWRNHESQPPIPEYFVKADDLTPHEHVIMQEAAQRNIDSSVSKTVNVPNKTTQEQVANLYMEAYDIGLKGITVYRKDSRDAVLTSLKDEKAKKENNEPLAPIVVSTPPTPLEAPNPLEPVAVAGGSQSVTYERPKVLSGHTYQTRTPVGTAFITINEDKEGSPREVFITVGRAGSDIAADAEALGRLLSLLLRAPSDLPPRIRLEYALDQLSGIGGGSVYGFGAGRVRSLADAVAKTLLDYSREHYGNAQVKADPPKIHINAGGILNPETATRTGRLIAEQLVEELAVGMGSSSVSSQPRQTTGDFCPSCGQIALVYEESCKKCYVCGYSAC